MNAVDEKSVQDKAKERVAWLQKVVRWCMSSQEARRLGAMVTLARSEPGMPVLPEQLDRDGWLLNCPNGTLDLRTGRLREHRREDYLTRLCPTPYEPGADCPVWRASLAAIFEDDEELITFVKRFLGHCLTGDVSEQVLPIFWGPGGNGKSVIVNAVMQTMGGDYAMKAPATMLMTRKGERHPTELADLFRKRLVVASEPEQGCRLNEALVKDVTGGEPIRARRMREDFWQFDPTHKLVLLTNHKPRVSGIDEGIWRRLRLVPFAVRFVKPDEPAYENTPPRRRADPQLGQRLSDELPGILRWLVEGCLEWQAGGLTLPGKVKAATAEYRTTEDTFALWLDERCVVGQSCFRTRAGDLYQSFKAWAERQGEDVCGIKGFGSLMEQKGFEKTRSNGTWYIGIALQTTQQDDEE